MLDWMSAEHAISHVRAITGGDRVRAELELCHHAAQAGIETRGRRRTGEGFGEPESIPPALWKNARENGFAATFRRVGDFQQQLEFRGADLLALYPLKLSSEQPPRNRPVKVGRPSGRNYAKADAPIIAEMRDLVASGQCSSPTEAARQVIGRDGKGAKGDGSPESKVARLVKGIMQSAKE